MEQTKRARNALQVCVGVWLGVGVCVLVHSLPPTSHLALQRRLKEEGQSHHQERRKLETQEAQSRQREQAARRSAARLEEQLQTKERVWQGQLQARDREIKALKVRLWPAWKCHRQPCIGSHPGTPTLSLLHTNLTLVSRLDVK